MLVSTSIPLALQTIPPRAQVVAIYATVTSPCGDQQRVRIRDIRNVYDIDPASSWLVADVIGIQPHITQGFSVHLEDLHNLVAIVTQEVW